MCKVHAQTLLWLHTPCSGPCQTRQGPPCSAHTHLRTRMPAVKLTRGRLLFPVHRYACRSAATGGQARRGPRNQRCDLWLAGWLPGTCLPVLECALPLKDHGSRHAHQACVLPAWTLYAIKPRLPCVQLPPQPGRRSAAQHQGGPLVRRPPQRPSRITQHTVRRLMTGPLPRYVWCARLACPSLL